jgi:hypothetical protein
MCRVKPPSFCMEVVIVVVNYFVTNFPRPSFSDVSSIAINAILYVQSIRTYDVIIFIY